MPHFFNAVSTITQATVFQSLALIFFDVGFPKAGVNNTHSSGKIITGQAFRAINKSLVARPRPIVYKWMPGTL